MARLTSELVVRATDRASGPLSRLRGIFAGFRGEVARTERLGLGGLGMLRGTLAAAGAYVSLREATTGTVGAALKFESAMSDVRKVVDVSDEQFANMRQSIIGLSKQMPVTAEGFASIYAAAAQSGVAQNELRGFAEGVVRMSTAWDTAVDTTGEALAKIKTALGRDIRGTMALGDAINHVSNVSAASAPDMLEYTNRVAAFAETAGFSAEQALAFGAAMVGSGFAPEVAATSFRNLTARLAKGTKATKEQRVAFKQLGLDAVKVAKGMQKNAVGTTLDVLDKIKKLPEWQQISIANALFGEEARGLAPLIRDSGELRRLLSETGDAAKYAGSAYKEYITRAQTTGNVLQILRNKMSDVFRGWGDAMLPSVKDAALEIGHVLDTLENRVNPFDKLDAGMRGFVKGLGYDGGVREAVRDLGNLAFGFKDGTAGIESSADQLGRVFMRAREWGASLRTLNDAIRESPLSGFLSSVGGYGMQLAAASVGLAIFAGAVRSLAGALYFLTGAKAAVGILKTLGRGGRWLANATVLSNGAAEIAEGTTGKPPAKLPARPVTKTPNYWRGPWGDNAPRTSAGPTGPRGLGQQLPKTPPATMPGTMLGEIIRTLGLGGTAAAGALSLNFGQLDWFKSEWEKERQKYLNDRIRQHFGKTKDDGEAKPKRGALSNYLPSELTRPLGDLPRPTLPVYEPPRTRGGVSDVRPMPTGAVTFDTVAAENRVEQLATELTNMLQIDGRANFDGSAIQQAISDARTLVSLLQQAGQAAAGLSLRAARVDYSGLQSDLEYSVA